MDNSAAEKLWPDLEKQTYVRRQSWRRLKDGLTRYYVAAGGICVIVALLLIFLYLLYVVLPLFHAASLELVTTYAVPGGVETETLFLATEEYAEVGIRVTRDGRAIFFRTADGGVLSEQRLPLPARTSITSAAGGSPSQGIIVLGLSNGTALVFKHSYRISYPKDRRSIAPAIVFPLGEQAIEVDSQGFPLTHITAQHQEQGATLVGATIDGRLVLVDLQVARSLLDDSVSLERSSAELPLPGGRVTHLALNEKQRELYVTTDDGFLSYYDVTHKSQPKLIDHRSAVPDGAEVTELSCLSGGISILVGDSRGVISQWFPVRDENNKYTLTRVRDYTEQRHPITGIAPEYFRKGFAAIDQTGDVGIYHTTAHRTLVVSKVSELPLTHASLSPRADALLLLDSANKLYVYRVDNEYPEVSWRSLWGEVWYESRERPELIWQSSSASSEFEPKFSLTPLAFGTLKAAVYAMLFAMPLAILGAIYTGFFMSPRMRGLVKPTIEIMGALPSVILGFLAGLWLAPLVEKNLPGIFSVFILTPVAVLLCAFLWHLLPARLHHWASDGWEAAILIPVVCAVITLAMAISPGLEMWLFDGNMPAWITTHLGLDFDQRNSLVVGIAMGFAIIPLIFSISEDAIFAVPRHLTIGSLALGATPWQTLVRVVLLTASPGIFSGVMIGLGRAVGETMIVLMATGNTPLMHLNIFEGFRALSANVAVEMPEAEVNGTHYRILFLASLVLFLVTFIFNTVAELVRQRLRAKYSSL